MATLSFQFLRPKTLESSSTPLHFILAISVGSCFQNMFTVWPLLSSSVVAMLVQAILVWIIKIDSWLASLFSILLYNNLLWTVLSITYRMIFFKVNSWALLCSKISIEEKKFESLVATLRLLAPFFLWWNALPFPLLQNPVFQPHWPRSSLNTRDFDLLYPLLGIPFSWISIWPVPLLLHFFF